MKNLEVRPDLISGRFYTLKHDVNEVGSRSCVTLISVGYLPRHPIAFSIKHIPAKIHIASLTLICT